jgi:citrate synthase
VHIPTLGHGFDWSADRVDWPVTTDVGRGLTGVIAGETRVIWLDPSSGRLAYRGVPIETLAGAPDFEAAAFLLITGASAGDEPLLFDRFRGTLRSSRQLPPPVLDLVDGLGPSVHPTRAQRAGVSALGCHELAVDDDLAGQQHWRELRIVGQVTALVGAIIDRRRGRDRRQKTRRRPQPVRPYALAGRPPTADERALLDLLWVLYAAHGLDTPTFTSMIVASPRADPYYTVVCRPVGAARRPPGGAGERVLSSLLALEDAGAAERWARQTIDDGGTIPGFGHPSYRMPDPRVMVLRKAAATHASRLGKARLFEVARAVEEEATRRLAPRGVFVNVNLYGAVLFHLLGPAGRGAVRSPRPGWPGIVALVEESLDTVRLYRRSTRYVGPPPRPVPREAARDRLAAARGSQRYHRGLAGLVAGDTAISDIDGERGRLLFRGYPVGELAAVRPSRRSATSSCSASFRTRPGSATGAPS